MKTSLTRESASKVRLSVEATAEEVAPSLARAVKALGEQVKIPGFRKGKVPQKVLESRLGADAVREAALNEAIPALMTKAVEEQELQPIAPPNVDVTSYDLGGDLVFDATVEVRPEFELPDLAGIKVRRPSASATDEEIEDQLGRLRDRFATLNTVERPANPGDFALIDIHGTLDGAQVEALSGTDQLFEVAQGFPIQEIDQQLTGAKAGDILEFDAQVPDGVGGDVAGKQVRFRILVKEVKQKDLPALDDEFAKTASEFETLEELRTDVRERIDKVKAVQVDAEVRNRVLEELLAEVDVEAPDALVNQEMAYRLHRFEDQLRAAGMTLDEYMQANDFSDEQVEADLRTQAERNVRAQMILEEIGRKEGFQVTKEELEQEVRYHAETMRIPADELAKELSDRGRILAMAGDIIRRKALNHVVELADIEEEDPQGAGSTEEHATAPPAEQSEE